ncbi:MAG: Type 1 glutamine amidotransferase-like domain-containing protein [Lachnospiraceae bacterium]|jgi:dipeptidase E|nr:Type 1 glutamine amidotransferase-like domain-containing protein [Lachnospiraceae bacterium]
MKLYLSSYKLGNKTEVLKQWLQEHKNNKIGLIPNSRDFYSDGERKTTGLLADSKDLQNLGFEVVILDLRDYFNRPEVLAMYLEELGGVYVVGGNTFVLRKAFKLSGFDEWVKTNYKEENFIYAGYSAGICLLS